MSVFYHPYLFDAERFADGDPDEGTLSRVGDAIEELGAVPDEAVGDRDMISARIVPEPYRPLGGLFDAVAYHLGRERPGEEREALELLGHLAHDTGRLAEATDYEATGYLSAAECGRLLAALRAATLDDPIGAEEKDLAEAVLAYAAQHGAGLVVLTG